MFHVTYRDREALEVNDGSILLHNCGELASVEVGLDAHDQQMHQWDEAELLTG